ncbi:MAG TPA: hypothetical protein VLM85_19780 [Polyangiaceae bacterium]|nr:hypothetical protein [Polyangiaceae bacterium]
MLLRRSLAAGALAASMACGPAPATPKAEVPIELPRTVDLTPSAGLTTLVEAHPRALLAHPELLPLVATVLPEEQFQVFEKRHGGVDPRQLEDLVVASYRSSRTPERSEGSVASDETITLVLARGDFDPARLERAFAERTTRVSGRFVDRPGGPLSTVLRLEGTSPSATPNPTEEHDELLLLGRQVVGYESRAEGAARVGPLRVSELFALRKLQRARPALAAAPLDAASRALGDAPVRVFFPGPFEGETAKGLGGLLRAATAVGIAVRPAAASPPGVTALDVTIVLLGAWNEDAQRSGERFAAIVSSMTREDLGRLCGLHEPLRGPDLRVGPQVLTLEATIDARKLAFGAHAATASQIGDIMKD